MEEAINYLLVDFVLSLFHGYLPDGENYSVIVAENHIPKNQAPLIFDFLIQEELIKKINNNDTKYILTLYGIKAAQIGCGIENYLKSFKRQNIR